MVICISIRLCSPWPVQPLGPGLASIGESDERVEDAVTAVAAVDVE